MEKNQDNVKHSSLCMLKYCFEISLSLNNSLELIGGYGVCILYTANKDIDHWLVEYFFPQYHSIAEWKLNMQYIKELQVGTNCALNALLSCIFHVIKVFHNIFFTVYSK